MQQEQTPQQPILWRIIDWLIEKTFNNPLTRTYTRMLGAVLPTMNRNVGVFGFISAFALIAYYGDFFYKLKMFGGGSSLRTSDFLTANTAIPYAVYAIAGLFLAPFLCGQAASGDKTTGRVQGGAAVGVLFATAAWVLLPYGVLSVVSYH